MASLQDLLSAMQNGVTAIQTLNTTLKSFFPQATSLSTSVTVGTITFTSSQAAGFMIVTTSSGYTVKVPVYGT